MERLRERGATHYGTPDAAAFRATLMLAEPRRMEIVAEGPLAYPHALQRPEEYSAQIAAGRPLDHGLQEDLGLGGSVGEPNRLQRRSFEQRQRDVGGHGQHGWAMREDAEPVPRQ